MSPAGEPVWRLISAATMKMPEPIIEPTTIMVPSKRPMARTKPCSEAGTACEDSDAGAVGLRVPSAGVSVLGIREASGGSGLLCRSQRVEILLGTQGAIVCAENVA